MHGWTQLICTEVNITAEDVSEKHVKPRLSNHGSGLAVKATTSDSSKPGTWKDVEMTDCVHLVSDFGGCS